ncbi:MAG: WG repeat-containing protein, partial [Prevotellaceae bacterium]|nr:WG repeat-containing protein [Prevotellaceae bacterium]
MEEYKIIMEIFETNGKCGLRYHETGKIIIPPIYDSIEGWNIEDIEGNDDNIIRYSRDFADEFDELCLVCSNSKWGYVDVEAKEVIPPKYSDARQFSEGLASVKIAEKWGFIDKTDTLVIPPQYDDALWFENGLAMVEIADKHGVINKSGNLVIPAIYDVIDPLFDGTFFVKKKDEYGNILDRQAKALYDSAAKCTKRFRFNTLTQEQRVSALFVPPCIYRVQKNGKFGYLFGREEKTIPLIYDEANAFFYCDVPRASTSHRAFGFENELACIRRDGKYGCINSEGEEVIKPIYDEAISFNCEYGLAQVCVNGKSGFIDM